jgi:hypothetical protein
MRRGSGRKCTEGNDRVTMNTHPLDVWKDLIPEKAPQLDDPHEQVPILASLQLRIERDHARIDQLRCVRLESADRTRRPSRDDDLDVTFDEEVQVLAVVHRFRSKVDSQSQQTKDSHRILQRFVVE